VFSLVKAGKYVLATGTGIPYYRTVRKKTRVMARNFQKKNCGQQNVKAEQQKYHY
jgi:ribosomal protein L30E